MASKTINTRHIIRNDTASNWASVNPTLALGELGVETDTSKLKVGDGTSKWNSLSYISGSGITSRVIDATLTASKWSNKVQTLTVSNAVDISSVNFPSTIKDSEYTAAVNAKFSWVVCDNGEIKIIATGTTPTVDIPLQLVVGLNSTKPNSTDRYWVPTVSTSGSTQVLTLNLPSLNAYTTGTRIAIKYTGATTTNATINVNLLGAKTILGKLVQNNKYILVYNGTNFVSNYWEVTVPTTGWSSTPPYTQTITVSGITAQDIPLINPIYNSATITRALEKSAYSLITMVETTTNAIKVTCDDLKPATAINLAISL